MKNGKQRRSVESKGQGMQKALAIGLMLGAAALGACESPMNQGTVDRASGRYADALVARGIMNGTYRGETLSFETESQGVRELVRVDSAGPTSGPAGEAVTPATMSAVAATSTAGAATQARTTLPGIVGGDFASKLNSPENLLNLSLQDAIARALKNALTIKVEAYNPAIKESQIIQAQAAFDPVVFGQSSWSSTDQPIGFTPFTLNGQNWLNQVGMKRKLETGGTVQAFTGVTYLTLPRNSTFTSPFNSSYSSVIGMSLTQPLLRGFGEDVNKADIYLAQRDHRISLSQFRQQVIKTVADVETAYYQLMLAKANVGVQEWLLQQTVEMESRVKKRLNIDADQITLSQAVAAVESRSAELIRARSTLRNASDQLKNAINDPELDIRQNGLINPSDKPISEPIVLNVGEQIDIALRQRPELQQARLQIERADIVLKATRNALLPKADLTLSVQSNGLDSSLDAAFGGTINPANSMSYGAGLQVEFPLGNNDQEAKLYQTKQQREQVLVELVQAAQSIVLDVKLQLRDVLTSYQEIQARERSRIAAANQLDAFTKKEEIVQLTPEFLNLKLQAQAQLAQAQLAEIAAFISYSLAITKLEQAKGTLLEYNRIAIDQPPPAKNAEDFGKIRFMGHTYTVK